MSQNNPTPTGSQWTGEDVRRLLYAEGYEAGIGDIVAAHNAAIAAVPDDFTRYHHNPIVAQLRDQLDAQVDRADDLQSKAESLQEQLDAAVEAIAWLNEFVVQPEYFPGEGDRQWWQEKRAALAKIGGK